MLPCKHRDGRPVNLPPGYSIKLWRAAQTNQICDNWYIDPHDNICTGKLTNIKRREVRGGPAYCRACAAAGLGGGLKGDLTGYIARHQPGLPNTWCMPSTSAERRELGYAGRGGTWSMTDAEVAEVLRSEPLEPVMKEEPGIQRGRRLGALYNFELQLKRAREAPSGSRLHVVYAETEILLGLVYWEKPAFHWDIETRQTSGPGPKSNPRSIYDTAIHERKDWRDPFERAKPFMAEAEAYHNPAPMRAGMYPKEVIVELKAKLGKIAESGAYCITWFGHEASYAREMGHGACIIDAGYLVRNLLGFTPPPQPLGLAAALALALALALSQAITMTLTLTPTATLHRYDAQRGPLPWYRGCGGRGRCGRRLRRQRR